MKTFLTFILLFVVSATGYCEQPIVTKEEAKQLADFQLRVETEPKQAIADFVEFLVEKESPALRFALAVYYLQESDLKKGASHLKKVIAQKPDYHQARFEYAKVLLQQENFKAGATELTTLLQSEFPQKLDCWKFLGYCHMALNKSAAAETAYRQALVLDASNQALVRHLIRSLFAQEKFEEARPLIRQQLKADPINAKWWELLAGADLRKGDHEDALIRLECARRLGVASDAMLTDLAELYLHSDLPEQAATLYKYLVAGKKSSAKRLIGGVVALVYSDRIVEAEELMKELKSEYNLSTKQKNRLQLLSADLLVQKGKQQKALEAYDQILKHSPLEVEALRKSADILRQQKQYEKAIIRYQRLKRMPKQKAKALVGLAQIEVQKGNYRPAVLLIEESLTIEKDKYVLRYLKSIKKLVR